MRRLTPGRWIVNVRVPSTVIAADTSVVRARPLGVKEGWYEGSGQCILIVPGKWEVDLKSVALVCDGIVHGK